MNQQNTIREEWKATTKKDVWSEYGKHIGCCGGDYCDGDHNGRTADWWLECTIPLSSLTAWIEGEKQVPNPNKTLKQYEIGHMDGYNQALKDLSTFIESKK